MAGITPHDLKISNIVTVIKTGWDLCSDRQNILTEQNVETRKSPTSVPLTLQQHRCELCGFNYMGIFSKVLQDLWPVESEDVEPRIERDNIKLYVNLQPVMSLKP